MCRIPTKKAGKRYEDEEEDLAMIDVGEIAELSERKIIKLSDLVDSKKMIKHDISSNSL